jgi:hypothetical protein
MERIFRDSEVIAEPAHDQQQSQRKKQFRRETSQGDGVAEQDHIRRAPRTGLSASAVNRNVRDPLVGAGPRSQPRFAVQPPPNPPRGYPTFMTPLRRLSASTLLRSKLTNLGRST